MPKALKKQVRRASRKALRKPSSKPKQVCMKIVTKKSVISNKELIEDFVVKLYGNKRWEEPFEPSELLITTDMREKRVCISLNRKINTNYLRLEDINTGLKPKYLKVNSDIELEVPKEDVLVHHLESKTKTKVPIGHKWVTLEHNGPYFTWIMEPYQPHGVPLVYDGKKYKLSPNAEKVANFWARRITTDETATISHTKDSLFRSNFWKDFKTYLSPANKKIMKDFNKMNFDAIRKKLIELKEAETDTIKTKRKKESEERKHDYGYAMVNGVREAVSNFVPEPAGLFLGRGKNKMRGRVKRDINPSEVTINIGKSAKVPKPPKGKWKKVVHDTKAEWISKWSDPLNGKPKYIRLSDQGQFKSDSDAGKFENARKLNKFLEQVRKGYQKNIESSNKKERQLATVIWLVDQYGIRMGGEKGELEAKTYGASTLLVNHITFTSPDKINLDFLGKDSIRYKKTLNVNEKVFKNLKDFVKSKSKNTPLFDLVSASDINCYLKTFDKGLKGKVFRTRLGSTLMYEALAKTKIKKNSTDSEKKKAFINANIIVAKALNHQKTVAKGVATTIEKLKKELKELQNELKTKKKAGTRVASLEKRVQDKKDSIESKQKLQAINPGTSLTNYIDPRLVTAWCKAHNLPIEKVYTKTLASKFKWAIDETDAEWDYIDTPLMPGYEKLQPGKDDVCILDSNTKKTKQVLISDSSSEDDEPVKPVKRKTSPKSIMPHKKNHAVIKKYHDVLKKYGYALVKTESGILAVQRVSHVKLNMQMKGTYKNIYDVSNDMQKEQLGILAMLLIGQVCKDATNNSRIKKAVVTSGYLEKFKDIVRNAI
jgi:DNA topoisomerase-1